MFHLPNLFVLQRIQERRKYYNKFSEKYDSFLHLLEDADKPSVNHYKSYREITFKNRLKFGVTYQEVIKLLGKPLVNYSNPKSPGHQILLYKYSISSNKIKCEVHLYQNRFILGIYVSDYMTNDRQDLKKYFLERYLGNKHLVHNSNFRISDPVNNSVYVNDSVCLELIYLSHTASALFHNNFISNHHVII
ncbi:MAG TPA: hypothetical protein VIH57_11465 [Bacteroidales bacterium]